MKNSQSKNIPAVKTVVDAINGTVIFTFANGKTFTARLDEMNAANKMMSALHGIKQKVCDGAAIARDPDTGLTATIDTKYAAAKEIFDRITAKDGEWNKNREGGGATGGLLLSALIRLYEGKKTKEQLTAYLEGLSATDKTVLRNNKRVAPIIEEIRAERAKEDGVDSDELLGAIEKIK